MTCPFPDLPQSPAITQVEFSFEFVFVFCLKEPLSCCAGDRNRRDDVPLKSTIGRGESSARGSGSSAGERPSSTSPNSDASVHTNRTEFAQQCPPPIALDLALPSIDKHINGYADSDDQVRLLQAEIDELEGDY